MKTFLNILLFSASAALLICFCFCVPSPVYGGGAETLCAFSGFRLTVFGVGAGIAMLTAFILAGLYLKSKSRPLSDALLFAVIGLPLTWLAGKAAYLLSAFGQAPVKDVILPQSGGINPWGAAAGFISAGLLVSLIRKTGIGKMTNASGLGLLPGLTVACIFRSVSSPQGGFVWAVPFTGGTVTVNPFLAEAALFLAAFAATMLWLIFRKTNAPDNGDLLLTAIALCGTARLLLIMFATVIPGSPMIWSWRPQALAFAFTLIPLAVWTIRLGRSDMKKGYIPLCWFVFLAAGTGIVMRTAGKWSVPMETVDAAVTTALILLLLKSVCCMGRVSRKLSSADTHENIPEGSGVQPSAES